MRPYRMTATLDCSGQVCVPDVRPAPSLAVERCERAAVKALMAWTRYGSIPQKDLVWSWVDRINAARARARRARKESTQ